SRGRVHGSAGPFSVPTRAIDVLLDHSRGSARCPIDSPGNPPARGFRRHPSLRRGRYAGCPCEVTTIGVRARNAGSSTPETSMTSSTLQFPFPVVGPPRPRPEGWAAAPHEYATFVMHP